MSYISPRSLQLLHHLVNEDNNNGEEDDLYDEQTTEDKTADDDCRVENMNGTDGQDFKETLNFFEKLQKENGAVGDNGDVLVNGYVNGHVENGIEEDTLQGIAEESEEDSYTVTEVSETTADTSNLDVESTKVFKRKKHPSKVIKHNRDHNHKYKPAKASSVRDNSTDGDSLSDQVETMSDSGRMGRRQRKLNKRAQIRAFRPLGVEPLETAEVKLEKKYEELEQLMSGQFVEQKRALGINHIKQMELLRQQYAIASHGLPPTGVLVPRSMPAEYRRIGCQRQTGGDKENVLHPASEDDAYTTIRTLQATKGSQRRSRARSARTRPLSASRQNQSRSTSRDRRDRKSEKEQRRHSAERSKERGRRGNMARSSSSSRSRSSSGSPRRPLAATETHLKNTENEFIREWIKNKDIEYRRKKAEERKKKKLERKEKIEKRLEREEKFKDSMKTVQSWMKQKRKEAYHKQKHEKEELKKEMARKAHERAKKATLIDGWGVDRPMSATPPIRTDRSKIRVSRPGTTVEEVQAMKEQQETALENKDGLDHQEVPQPPVTKYVYRRPVLGKVRLRTKQQQPQAEPKPAPVKKPVEKPLTKEEIEKKQRISYDDWLQHKRKDDTEKKKETERQKALAESEPVYERPVPDLVQNGHHNVLKGKGIPGVSSARPAYISRVISQEERDRIREMALQKKPPQRSLEEEVDTSYDERSESPEDAIQRVAKNVVSYVLRSLSDDETEDGVFDDNDQAEHEGLANLGVYGSKASFSNKTRPMSASVARIPGPQSSKSPRRPVSAQPKPKPVSREAVQGALPFPSDIGAPSHVQRIQNKLFLDRESMWQNPEGDLRPEPQGSDSYQRVMVEDRHQSLVEAMDRYQEEPVAQQSEDGESSKESLQSSKKRVSFCEQTTVFDESDVGEDIEEWQDEDTEQDTSDLEKARKLFLEADVDAENSSPSNGFFITTTDEVQINTESES